MNDSIAKKDREGENKYKQCVIERFVSFIWGYKIDSFCSEIHFVFNCLMFCPNKSDINRQCYSTYTLMLILHTYFTLKLIDGIRSSNYSAYCQTVFFNVCSSFNRATFYLVNRLKSL